MSAAERGFNAKIFLCIDNALGSLGEGVKQSFYHQLKERSNLTADKFATKPLELIGDLRDILGTAGSSIVEKLIVREIRRSFGLNFHNGVRLSDAIAEAKKAFLVDAWDKETQ
ncbi:MAG: hypothetical protein OK457_09775 [Thaumarchaeota archaeon]|nr:hypothetical protein [Nitrososphaerota archaeon]